MRTSKVYSFFTLVALALISFSANTAFGHSIHVFAYIDGDQIKGEGAYGDGGVASGMEIQIHDKDGRLVGAAKTSQEGTFTLPRPQGQLPFNVSINDGTGHLNTFTISKDELTKPKMPVQQPVMTPPPPAAAVPKTEHETLSKEEIICILREEIAPLKAQIARLASKDTWGLREIMGGVGWIIGLAGLAMWIFSRKERTSLRKRQ